MSLFYEGLNEALPDAPATRTRGETRRVSPKDALGRHGAHSRPHITLL